MKPIKNFVFILIILYLANTVHSAISNKKFYLNQKDVLRLPIEEFLEYDQYISLLTHKTESSIDVIFPEIAHKVNLNIDDRSGLNHQENIQVVDSASYENFTAKLYKDSNEQFHVIFNAFGNDEEGLNLSIEKVVNFKEHNCKSVEMDNTNIYIGCFNYFQSAIILCSYNYQQMDAQQECQTVYEHDESTKPIFQNQDLKSEIFTDSENTIVMLYIENSNINLFKNNVIIYQSGMSQILHIQKQDLHIKKLQLVDYQRRLQIASFLILSQSSEDKLELFYYKFEATKALGTTVVSIKSQDIIDYQLIGSQILLLKKITKNNQTFIEITELDIYSKNERIYELTDLIQTDKNVYLSELLKLNDSTIICLQEETSQQLNSKLIYLHYDYLTKRISKFEAGFGVMQNYFQKQVHLFDQNYIYVETLDSKSFYRISPCRFITVENRQNIERANILFSYQNKDFFDIDLRYVDDKGSIDFTQKNRLKLKNSQNYNPIRYYSNQTQKLFTQDTLFLNEVKLEQEIYEDLDICDTHQIKIIKNVLLDFCQNGILDFHYLKLVNEVSNNKYSGVLKKIEHKSAMPLPDIKDQENEFNIDDIIDYNLIYEEIVIMLSNKNQVFYYHTKNKSQQVQNIQIEQDVINCSLEFYKVVCEKDQQTYVFSFKYIDQILQLKEENIINVQKNLLAISQIKQGYIAYLIQYPQNEFYNLIGQNQVIDLDVQIKSEYINKTTKLYEVSEDNYLIVSNIDGKLFLMGIKNSSLIQYPDLEINYKNFRGVSTTQHSNYFIIVYLNEQNRVQFSVLNSSYQALHRIITTQQLKKVDEGNVSFSIQELDQDLLIINVGNQDNLSSTEFYVFRKDGPLIINNQQQPEVVYMESESDKVIKNSIKEFDTHLRVKTNQLGLEKDENIVTKNLEELSIVQIDGDYIQVEQPSQQRGYYIQDRLRSVKKNYLIKESHLVQEDFNLQSNAEGQTLSLVFNKKFYRSNHISSNQLYKNCQVVINSDWQKGQLENNVHYYICKDKISKSFVLTNFRKQNIKLRNLSSVLNPSKSYLMFVNPNQFYLVISLDSNHHDIVIYEFNSNDDSYELSRQYFFNSNQLNDQFEPYKNFYSMYNKKLNSVLLIFNSQFSMNLDIYEYNLKEKIVQLKKMKRVKLIGDDRSNLLSIEFQNQEEHLECVYATEVSLNVIYLNKRDDQDWTQNIVYQKTIKTGLTASSPKIIISENYLGLLINRDEKQPNVLIWRKNNDDYIYYGLSLIQLSETATTQNYKLYVLNVHFRENNSTNYLDVIYLQKDVYDEESLTYDSLVLQTFEIGELSITLDKELVSVNGLPLKFFRLEPAGVINQQLFVRSDEYKKVILHTAIVILLILIIVLAIVAQGIWQKNKELKHELNKDMRERDLASERL